MKAVAEYSAQDLTQLTWAVFWRYVLIGGIGTYAAGFVTGFVVGLVGMFIALVLGISRDVASDTLDLIASVAGGLAGLAAAFWILRRILASRIGKSVGTSTFFIVAITNDKDISHAN